MNVDGSSIDVKSNETLSSRLEHLVGNKFCSDLTFIIEDTNEEIPAHKLLVSLSSPVLHKIVYGTAIFPPKDIIELDGISKESFMQILLYIYTDKINLTEDNVIEILGKSNYFGLPGIESKCWDYLEETLSVSNVPWIYHQLFFSGSTKLLNKCRQYIRIQPLEFFASEYFEKIRIEELKSILELDAINCTEVDLFEAMVRLSKAHCAAAGREITAKNQREILAGTETLLRLESLTESEFDQCLAIQKDFYCTAEVERIRTDIRNAVAPAKRKWYTYQDAVWIEMNRENHRPPSAFYSGTAFIHRTCKGEEPQVSDSYTQLVFGPEDPAKVEILCGSGYEWVTCVNGEIPFGSVPFSLKHSEPRFIARGSYRGTTLIGPAHMNGTMTISRYESFYAEEKSDGLTNEFEILVARNVKNPYNGDGVPTDAIFVDYDDNNHKTYLGRAWFRGDLLPAKVIQKEEPDVLQREVYVSFGGRAEHVNEFEFVRMDRGTYKWEQNMNGKVPTNAVIGGCAESGERLYFGRTMHHGNYIPGKVHPSHKVLYVAFRGQEINFRSYEVLVHAGDIFKNENETRIPI